MIERGEIWWAGLPEPAGSEPGYRRPVLVVQANPFNRSAIRTVIAAALTTNVALAKAPGNVLLSRRESGLPRDSVVNVSQVLTLNKDCLTERVRKPAPSLVRRVDEGLRLVLGL